jgi:hypothetical protein
MALIEPNARPVVEKTVNTFNGVTTTIYATCAKSGVMRKL